MLKTINNFIKLLQNIVYAPLKALIIVCMAFLLWSGREIPSSWENFILDILDATKNSEDDDEPVNISLSAQ